MACRFDPRPGTNSRMRPQSKRTARASSSLGSSTAADLVQVLQEIVTILEHPGRARPHGAERLDTAEQGGTLQRSALAAFERRLRYVCRRQAGISTYEDDVLGSGSAIPSALSPSR